MADEPLVLHPPLPPVEHGLMLGWPCPQCLTFSRKLAEPSGVFTCSMCGQETPPAAWELATRLTAFLVNEPSSQ